MSVSCRKCKHFAITWDSQKPYGCKAFGIKSKQMPSIEVYYASGRDCLKFEAKMEAKNKKSR